MLRRALVAAPLYPRQRRVSVSKGTEVTPHTGCGVGPEQPADVPSQEPTAGQGQEEEEGSLHRKGRTGLFAGGGVGGAYFEVSF